MSTVKSNPGHSSHALFKELVQLNKSSLFPEVYCLLSPESHFVAVSPSCEINWGYKAKELIGKPVSLFIKTAENSPAPIFSQDAPPVSGYYFLTKAGTVIPVNWIIQWDETEKLFYCVIRGNGEKRALTAKLVQTEERLKRVMHMSRMGNWEKDFRTGEVYSSDEVFEIFGLANTGQPGVEVDDFFRLVHAEDLERVLTFYQNLANAESIDIEHRLIRPDGKTVFLRQVGRVEKDDEGNVVLVSGTVQDITAIREKEEEILKANQRYELISNATHDVIWDWDLQSNTVWWNQNFKIQFGYEPQEIFDFWLDAVHPEDRERIMAEVKQVMEQGMQVWAGEHRFRKADGTYLTVFDRAFIAYDQNGKPMRMIGSVLDITRQKKVEKKLEDLNRKLRHLSGYLRKAQEKQKAHAASVLHEELAQQLVIVKFDISQLGSAFGRKNAVAKEKLEHIFQLLNSSIALTRNLSYDMYPEILTDLGIVDAIEWYSKNFSDDNKIKVDFVSDLNDLVLPESTNINLFRLYQDCCDFLRIYFKAETITSSLAKEKTQLLLSLSSTLLPAEIETLMPAYSEQLDWLNITERVDLMDGQIELRYDDQHTVHILISLQMG